MSEEKKRFTVEIREKEDPPPEEPPFVHHTPMKPKTEQPWYEDTSTLTLLVVAVILWIIALTIIPFVPPPP